MIDYSKFDNIELSDDSDIEVHPNVDKQSFIRWKQRDIHEKRAQRNLQINQINVNLQMYDHLNSRVDAILQEPAVDLINEKDAFAFLNSKFDKDEVFQSDLVKNDEVVPYNEQIEDLIIQLKNDVLKAGKSLNNENLREALKGHKLKIDKLIVEQRQTLEKLKEEKASHIESDDLREGFNSSFINKSTSTEPPSVDTATSNSATRAVSGTTASSTSQVIQTINTPISKEIKPSKPLDQLGELELLQETEEYAEIPQIDLNATHAFLAKHLFIISEQQKDALLMTAFDAELGGEPKKAENIVYKALLLRFLDELLTPLKSQEIKLTTLNNFMSRIRDMNHPAAKAFIQEVDFTYNHIKTRSKVIQEEESQRRGDDDDEEEALIQLKSTDDNTKLTVDIPVPEDTERYSLFQELPPALQAALQTEDMDEVNKVFAEMKLEEAERCLETMNIAGIIGVEVLENEQEFEELKANLHKTNLEELQELENEEDDDDVVVSTADIVD